MRCGGRLWSKMSKTDPNAVEVKIIVNVVRLVVRFGPTRSGEGVRSPWVSPRRIYREAVTSAGRCWNRLALVGLDSLRAPWRMECSGWERPTQGTQLRFHTARPARRVPGAPGGEVKWGEVRGVFALGAALSGRFFCLFIFLLPISVYGG